MWSGKQEKSQPQNTHAFGRNFLPKFFKFRGKKSPVSRSGRSANLGIYLFVHLVIFRDAKIGAELWLRANFRVAKKTRAGKKKNP